MGSSSGSEAPPPPRIDRQIEQTVEGYLKSLPKKKQAEMADLDTQIDLARRLAPQLLEMQRDYAPQYNRQMIELERELGPEWSALQGEQRRREAEQAAAIAPALRSAEDAQTAAIRAQLGQQIEQELAAGASLDPDLQRELEQSIRGAQSARGMTRGAGPANAEALVKGEAALNLRRQRQQAANQFLHTQAATTVNPLSFVTGRQGQTQAQPYSAPMPQQYTGIGSVLGQGMNQYAQHQQALYNYGQAQAANQPRYGGFVGGALGAGLGLAVPGIGPALGAGLGFLGGSSTGW